MSNNEIKERLLQMFAQVFKPESLIDDSNPESEVFEFSIGFEFQDSKEQWHDAYMNIETGRIYKHQEPSSYETYGDPFGRGELVGGNITVESVDYGNIECFVNSDPASFQVKEEELFLALKNQN